MSDELRRDTFELYLEANKILAEIEEYCVSTLQDWPSRRGDDKFRSDLEMILDCINREGEWEE